MWQVLETKARFINKFMNGSVTVRQAETSKRPLTYARSRPLPPKPSRDGKGQGRTEIRKLDQLRSSHINQQPTSGGR